MARKRGYSRFKPKNRQLLNEAREAEEEAEVAEAYIGAAEKFMKAGRPKDALRNYKKSVECYDDCLEKLRDKDTTMLRHAGFDTSYYTVVYKRLRKKYARIAERLKKVIEGKWHGLEGKAVAVAIVGILGGIFFLSSNITGNVIGNMTNSTSNFLGSVLLVIGIIGGFFWLRSRR